MRIENEKRNGYYQIISHTASMPETQDDAANVMINVFTVREREEGKMWNIKFLNANPLTNLLF